MSILALQAGLLIDGTGRPPIRNGIVLIDQGRIVAAGEQSAIPLPTDAQLIDFSEYTLLPGLIDCHSHLNLPGDGTPVEDAAADGDDLLLLRSAENARLALQSGVTTLADSGGAGRTTFYLKQALSRGIVQGPRLRICGRALTTTRGHGWPLGGEAEGPQAVREAARQLLEDGADYIKVMASGGSTRGTHRYRASYTIDELRAAVCTAHEWGKRAVAHATCTTAISNALDAGFDVIAHCSFYEADCPDYDRSSSPAQTSEYEPEGRYLFRPDLARRIADQGVMVCPTMYTHRSKLLRWERLAEQRPLSASETKYLEALRERYRERCDNLLGLMNTGVAIAAGSDAGWGPPFGTFFREIEAMVDAGMNASDAIQAATLGAARCLAVDQEVGSLEPGKQADLLVVNGDPTIDIGALERVIAVFLKGERSRIGQYYTASTSVQTEMESII